MEDNVRDFMLYGYRCDELSNHVNVEFHENNVDVSCYELIETWEYEMSINVNSMGSKRNFMWIKPIVQYAGWTKGMELYIWHKTPNDMDYNMWWSFDNTMIEPNIKIDKDVE